jgi:luciferase family oxidoreductase group 1
MPGIASAATSVVIGHVAQGTKTIRVGAGGIMLPNHSPLVIAEQFGTLDALFPGRIDLGVGRAPGSDQITARALRRHLNESVDDFPRNVVELLTYFEPSEPNQPIRAVPGDGSGVPVWILGSSLFGAQLAAMLGLPYAFASHFAPDSLIEAIHVYRTRFKPSHYLDKPHVMAGFNFFAAPTDEEAHYLFTSQQQGFANLRRGQPGKLPLPVEDIASVLSPMEIAMVDNTLKYRAVGSPDTVKRQFAAFMAETGVDEVMITGNIHDHQKRVRSFEIAAEIAGAHLRAAAE